MLEVLLLLSQLREIKNRCQF